MSDVVGVVKDLSPNKGGYFGLIVDGKYYSTNEKSKPEGVNIGDTVEFDVQVNGDWRNIVKGSLKVVAAGKQASAPAAQDKAPAVDWDLKDKRIQQQSARNGALEFINILISQDAVIYGETKAKAAAADAKDKIEVLEALLEHYTNKFLNETQTVANKNNKEED